MKFRSCIVAGIAIFFALLVIAALRVSIVFAEPQAQATRVPTEEPTKRPYVFPTPVFIPPYADDTPAPRSTPVAPLPPGVDTYTVQTGDSPWIIAQKVYGDGTKYKLIMEANGLTDQTRLRVGTVLKIPSFGDKPAAPPAQETVLPESTPAPLAPNSAATIATPTPIRLASPFPTPAPTLTSSAIAGEVSDMFPMVITIASTILGVAAIVAGALAYLMFLRTRRIEKLSSSKQSIRLKH